MTSKTMKEELIDFLDDGGYEEDYFWNRASKIRADIEECERIIYNKKISDINVDMDVKERIYDLIQEDCIETFEELFEQYYIEKLSILLY